MTGAFHDYVIRAAAESDLPALIEMKRLAGPGLTSLAGPDETLAAHLAESARAFGPAPMAADNHYFLALEHRPTGAVVGLAQVKAAIGVDKPFVNFRVLNVTHSSPAAGRRVDFQVLTAVSELAGCTEIGSLFVVPAHRGGGIGRALARTRYMLMAAAPERFAARVIAELRGAVTVDGGSQFWEHLGRRFFAMSFEEADALSAASDNQFILDLLPKYPIYVALLPESARAVIGRTHPDGEGARKMLAREGFRYDGLIDIFDGGPLMTAPRAAIDTVKRARRCIVRAGAPNAAAPGLLARAHVHGFRCTPALIEELGEYTCVSQGALEALGLRSGEEALVCPPP